MNLYKMSNLRSVFINKEIKKIIELHMSIGNFTTRSKALENLLSDSPKYNELKKKFELFNTPSSTTLLEPGESPQEVSPANEKIPTYNPEDFLDLTKKSVGDLLNSGGETNEKIQS